MRYGALNRNAIRYIICNSIGRFSSCTLSTLTCLYLNEVIHGSTKNRPRAVVYLHMNGYMDMLIFVSMNLYAYVDVYEIDM